MTEADSGYKHYTPSKIEFIPQKNNKYYFNVASYQFGSGFKNQNQAKKYKSVLMSEIKRNAQKVSGYLKNSEQINNLVASEIYSEPIPDPYVKTRINSRRNSGSLSRIKDMVMPKIDEIPRNSLLIKHKKTKRLSKFKDSIQTDQPSSSDITGIDTSKMYILPPLTLTNDITPRDVDFTNDSIKGELHTAASEDLPIIRNLPKITPQKTPAEIVLKTENSQQHDKFTMINSTINEYLRKVSARPKETSVDKFIKAARTYDKAHSHNNVSLSSNRLEKASSHRNLHAIPTARISIDERIHSLGTDRASFLIGSGRINSKSTEKLHLPKINDGFSHITLPVIGESTKSTNRVSKIFRAPPPVIKSLL